MGQLILPTSGAIYLDTSVVIYSVEKLEPYATLLQPLWLGAQSGKFHLIGSELLLLETLVKPIRAQDTLLETTIRQLLTNSHEFHLLPISLPIIERAIGLRTQFNLKTPDAIHMATALVHGSRMFLTNDATFKRIPGIAVTVLADLVAT